MTANETTALPVVPPVLLILPVAMLGAGVGLWLGAAPTAIVLGAATLVAAIFLFWTSVRLLLGEDVQNVEVPDEGESRDIVQTERAGGDSLLEQKRAALSALADMERERALGKIDEADYEDVVAGLREQAKQVMKELDARVAPHRQEAERIAMEYLQQQKSSPKAKSAKAAAKPSAASAPSEVAPSEGTANESNEPNEAVETEAAAPAEGAPSKRSCAGCQTANDADAKFCKSCGATLVVKEEEAADAS